MGIKEVIVGAIIVYGAAILCGFYQIKEGYVGLVRQFGVLKKDLKEPGFHFRVPGYQQVLQLNVMLQTDIVKKIPCGTANGLLIQFEKIEVVNKLDRKQVYKTVLNYTQDYQKFWISDKIHHQINQFCSKHTLQQIYIDLFDKLDEEIINSLTKDLKIWAPGIEILSVRVTKPTIPRKILEGVENIEKLKVQYLISTQKEKSTIEERITNQTQRKIKAQSNLEVKKIQLEKQVQKKKNELKMAKIESDIIYEREKTIIQTEFMTAFQEAALYNQLFTPEYLRYLAGQSLTTNLTITLGDSVPNIVNNFPTKRK